MKINLVGIIVIILISLLLGGVTGYLINNLIPKTELKQAQITMLNEEENSKVEQIKYDGNKEIILDGKKYIVSYKEKLLPNDSSVKKIQLKLFLNDKKVKTIATYDYRDEDEQNLEAYSVDVQKFCKDYILIIVSYATPNYGIKDFYIVDKEGQFIDSVKWNGGTGIYNEDTKENLTYKLSEDSITIYEPFDNGDVKGATELEYTVSDDLLVREYIKDYYNVTLSGKKP